MKIKKYSDYLLLENKQDDFEQAIQDDDISKVELLLKDKRVDPREDDNYAIKWASIKNHKEIVKLLLKDERINSDIKLLKHLYNMDTIEEEIKELFKPFINFNRLDLQKFLIELGNDEEITDAELVGKLVSKIKTIIRKD